MVPSALSAAIAAATLPLSAALVTSVPAAPVATAARLDRRMGGPDIDENAAQTVPRRSVYFRHAPEKHAQFLAMFDSASTHECYRRVETVVPQQALAMAKHTGRPIFLVHYTCVGQKSPTYSGKATAW